jgi:hypothetical protein
MYGKKPPQLFPQWLALKLHRLYRPFLTPQIGFDSAHVINKLRVLAGA